MSLVLITGSCGLVGSESAEFFSKKGFEILGIDNNSRKLFFGKDGDINWIKNRLNKNLNNYKHFNVDITNYNRLEKIFKKYKKNIKMVIHAAAQPSHDWAKNNVIKDFDINAKGTINLLELTKKYCYDSPLFLCLQIKFTGITQTNYRLSKKRPDGRLTAIICMQMELPKKCRSMIVYIVFLEHQKVMLI